MPGSAGEAFCPLYQRSAGIAELAAFCAEHEVELVVMEATGGFERLAFALLWEAGPALRHRQPRAVRDFAEAMGFSRRPTGSMPASSPVSPIARGIATSRPPARPSCSLKALVTACGN